MLEEQFDLHSNAYKRHDNTLSSDFGHNWPYDYCSLVEFAKMEVGFEFENGQETPKAKSKKDKSETLTLEEGGD
jgi:hypothetical protein